MPPTFFLDEFDVKTDNIILCVGGTRKEKGGSVLLKSLNLIKKEDWLLVIVGRNMEYFQKIKLQFSDLFSLGKVIHLENISDEMLLSVYSSSKVFVLPSEQDAYPLAVLEAMASGLPVVISDSVGSSPLVLDNEIGFVVPYGDVSKLALKIKYLLNNDKEREEMSRRAKKTALKYTWKETAKGYMDVYRKVTRI